uniref:Uncharacterized protein n=1 Tax=Oryza nivara TaxID=4536 RepID=A0A0E0IDZ5_ORYNI
MIAKSSSLFVRLLPLASPSIRRCPLSSPRVRSPALAPSRRPSSGTARVPVHRCHQQRHCLCLNNIKCFVEIIHLRDSLKHADMNPLQYYTYISCH